MRSAHSLHPMQQSEEVRKYLRGKYHEYHTVKTHLDAALYDMFDPWRNPDEAYIPYCSSCLADYNEYKQKGGKECEIDHTRMCLWYDYFVKKIKTINPTVKLVLKKK
jgi:hypothetical protein